MTPSAPLATITPCISCPYNISVTPITVTSQYQTLSRCVPTTTCPEGKPCQTSYPFETYQYVSTVIPCAFSSSASSYTTVTRIDQLITISYYRTTITSFATPVGRQAKRTPTYSTIGEDYFLPYNMIGPLAIPGYGGSNLCTECGPDVNGARYQRIPVIDCTADSAGTRCVEYTKTLVSISAPAATSRTAVVCSTSFSASSAGTYTFRFPHTAPAATITARHHTYTIPAQPYTVWVTQWFGHGGASNIRTTVIVTITQTVPASTLPATATHSVSKPSNWGQGPWNHPPHPSSTSIPAGPGPEPWKTRSWHYSSTLATRISSSSSYLSPTTTHSATTSTASVTTSAPAFSDIPASVPEIYIIGEVANARYHRRALEYVSFKSGEDGILVSDINSASHFKLYRDYIIDSRSEFVGTDATSGSAVLEEFHDPASASSDWTESGGVLSFRDASFCYTPSHGALFIVLTRDSAPSGCISLVLRTAIGR
jgi:hypothetical protein